MSDEKVDETYAELAKTIAPLEQDRARRLLDNFKMYPERPVSEIESMTLATVQREVILPAETARQLEEITTEQGGRNWNETITRLVESSREPAAPPPIFAPTFEENFDAEPKSAEPTAQETLPFDLSTNGADKTSTYRGIELPQDPAPVQQVNKILWNLKHNVTADFFTVSYTGRDIDQFINVIKAAGVSTVVDIRNTPVSQYKPDFSKENLRSHLAGKNINYAHRPDLGVPTDVRRQAAEAGSRGTIWEWYQDNVIGKLDDDGLTQIAKSNGTVAFMCVEVAPEDCHRHLVFLELERAGFTGYDL